MVKTAPIKCSILLPGALYKPLGSYVSYQSPTAHTYEKRRLITGTKTFRPCTKNEGPRPSRWTHSWIFPLILWQREPASDSGPPRGLLSLSRSTNPLGPPWRYYNEGKCMVRRPTTLAPFPRCSPVLPYHRTTSMYWRRR